MRPSQTVTAARVLVRSGVVRPHSPRALARVVATLARWGMGLAGGFTTVAHRFPDRAAVVDELGTLTYAEVEARSNAVADSLSRMGVGEGDGVAVLVRNHRGFVDVSLGAAKLGADLLYLNTAFAGPQLAEVCRRERPSVLVHDEEFDALVDGCGLDLPRVLAWVDGDGGGRDTLEGLVRGGSTDRRTPPARAARSVILTSGTTGTPKGAPRGGGTLGAAVSLLSRMPLRAGWRCHVAAPLFHTWGWAHLNLAMLLGTTVVLTRRFEPADCLRLLREQRCDSLVVIPVMLQRILAMPAEILDAADLTGVRVVAASGSALPGDLAVDWMDRFGDTLHSVYGSTEVAWASVATPEELRAAPGTAGRPPVGTVVRLYDEHGRQVPTGEPGRVFVGNSMLFEGYSGGGGKESIDGLLASGDVGRFDERGLLHLEGRDDEMLVSGGENVFPQEVEDVLARHDAVSEAAAVGVPDPEYGQRLRAYVVLHGGAGGDEHAEELREWVRRHLARYKVPRDVVFLDALPRNATGKVLKRELDRS